MKSISKVTIMFDGINMELTWERGKGSTLVDKDSKRNEGPWTVVTEGEFDAMCERYRQTWAHETRQHAIDDVSRHNVTWDLLVTWGAVSVDVNAVAELVRVLERDEERGIGYPPSTVVHFEDYSDAHWADMVGELTGNLDLVTCQWCKDRAASDTRVEEVALRLVSRGWEFQDGYYSDDHNVELDENGDLLIQRECEDGGGGNCYLSVLELVESEKATSPTGFGMVCKCCVREARRALKK